MQLKYLKIQGYKNLDFKITFPEDGIAVLIGNNGSGKSNVLEAVSLVFGYYYRDILQTKYKNVIEKYATNFNYEIKYEINSEEIILNNKVEKNEKYKLPKKIYALYSGEDLKLWQNFYFPFYESYIRKVKNKKLNELPFIYINKYFWDIAILMLCLFDNSIEKLKLGNLKEIKFAFSDNLFKKDIKSNKIVDFTKKISKNEKKRSFTYQEFKDLYDYELRDINLGEKEQKQEFFELLLSAYLPDKELKTFKFIDNLELNFNNNLDFLDLSEGEKKLILLRLLFNVLLDENSILLLDEPDDNIHPANKVKLKELIRNCNLEEKNIIITTHSPTLAHFFEEKNILMLDNGKIISKDKKEIIEYLTDNNWTYQEINIILGSKKDLFLVEGKSDELFLQTSLNIFKKKELFNDLEFDYISVGGASGMKLFLEKFKTNTQRKVFALLDADMAGNEHLKDFLKEEEIISLKEKDFLIKNDFMLIYLPKPDFVKNNKYEIEDLFPNEIKKKFAEKKWKEKCINWQGTIKTIPKIDKNLLKESLKEEVEKFNKDEQIILKEEDFNEFKKIFNVIEKIKNESN